MTAQAGGVFFCQSLICALSGARCFTINNIRNKALRLRRQLSDQERNFASQTICQNVAATHNFKAAKTIACYLPMRDEVDTFPLIERAWRANKRVFVPITQKNRKMFFCEIRPNSTVFKNNLNIWEPESGDFIDPRLLQLVITPTVAFDKHNHRIGMGGGYYDRTFRFLRNRKKWLQPKLLGVAFNCQKFEKISPNPWDIRLYSVFSEISD